MANKMLLLATLFQTFIAMILAATCNIAFTTSEAVVQGPFPRESGICYSYNSTISRDFYSAWIDGAPSGTGYLQFFSDFKCQTILIEGPSPVRFTEGIIASMIIKSCT